MVSIRCKMMVKSELDKLGLLYGSVELGEVELKDHITKDQYSQLKVALLRSGLVMMDDEKAILIDKIKNVVIGLVHYTEEWPNINFSDHLSEKLQYDYTYLSNLFSEVTGNTIENYLIAHKIERVKELIIYNEFNLTQIAYKLNYSSVAHLSNQFKKVTGLTPTFFKHLKGKKRETLETLDK